MIVVFAYSLPREQRHRPTLNTHSWISNYLPHQWLTCDPLCCCFNGAFWHKLVRFLFGCLWMHVLDNKWCTFKWQVCQGLWGMIITKHRSNFTMWQFHQQLALHLSFRPVGFCPPSVMFGHQPWKRSLDAWILTLAQISSLSLLFVTHWLYLNSWCFFAKYWTVLIFLRLLVNIRFAL